MADDNRLELTRAAHEAMQPDRKSPLEGAMDFLASIAKITQGEAAGLAKPDAEADPPPKPTAALAPRCTGADWNPAGMPSTGNKGCWL